MSFERGGKPVLKKLSHDGGVEDADEILYSTPFGYMFPDLARTEDCLLPRGQSTTRGLLALGAAMADDTGDPASDSTTPSFFTYFGQFIDHDLTARTDRETEASEIFGPDGDALPITPRHPDEVVSLLKNGRRPQFDLDSVYGDGPALLRDPATAEPAAGAATTSDALYEPDGKLRIQAVGPTVDLARPDGRTALIADARNDENVNVSQLHAAVLAHHNAVVDGLAAEDPSLSSAERYVRARQYVCWTYQYLVVEEYLRAVCVGEVVSDVLRNGPAHYGPVSAGQPVFMPLEFSVAGFRFGHSMVRPTYELRSASRSIEHILGTSTYPRPSGPEILTTSAAPNAYRLLEEVTVDWEKFLEGGANTARRIDPSIAQGLRSLPFVGGTSVMAHLAKRNLLRGFSLGLPTGQAVAAACGVEALRPDELRDGEVDEIRDAVDRAGFAHRTPLWYYVLREAAVQTGGERLGVVGSRIVAECIVGLLKKDPNSYLNQYAMARNITKDGIEVPTGDGRVRVGSIEDFLTVAGVYSCGDGPARVPPRSRTAELGRLDS